MAKRGIDVLDAAGEHRSVGAITRRLALSDFDRRLCHGSLHRVSLVKETLRRISSTAPAWWKQAQKWVEDVRDGRNRWGQNAIERINELGLQKGTIGISGLAGLFRAPEGIIPYSSVKAIQDAFPQAKIVNATEMMQEIRAVKSAEEVSLLERSAAIVEKTIEAMVENANPGVSEKELYGAMVHAMLANGGELPTLFFLSGGPGISNSSFVPTDYRLQKGDRLIDEIEAKYAGYAAQAVCPVVLGAPDDEYQKMIDISRACFDAFCTT